MPKSDIVTSAIWAGVSLTVPNLDEIISIKGVCLPEAGTGKGGSIIKHDKAAAVVDHFFKMQKQCEKDRMANAIMGRKSAVSNNQCPQELLDLLCELDAENTAEFQQAKDY